MDAIQVLELLKQSLASEMYDEYRSTNEDAYRMSNTIIRAIDRTIEKIKNG